MRRFLFTISLCAVTTASMAQNVYELTAPAKEKTIYTGHLKMGGKSPEGGSIEVNSFYMSIDGKPVIPVMGEFHYSRYPNEQWEEQILKMKAGGVNVIPTYVFWNIHEEKEGQFDWTGDRDLRRFLQLCQKHDIYTIVRIGPFDHGEIRNGGIPDWLFAKPIDIRSNDINYLHYTGILYDQIAKQLEGLYYKDGGTIIGIQIENEHQHSAASWALKYPEEASDFTAATYDADFTMVGVSVQNKEITTAELGELHMKTLKKMAEDRGMITPVYTATGWGNAAVIGNEAIPVTAAYPYPVWGNISDRSEFCLFKDIQKNPDYAPVRYETDKFPSFCAEMGAGIQMTYSKRPVISAKGAETLMLRSVGSGANGIGYYMYNGGSTPKMKDGIGFFSEEVAGVPKISYDFQAPLGEFGLEKQSYRNLRLLHSFLEDFGEQLAPMETVLPEGYDKITPDNRETLRYAARMKDNAGFLFMINFQDHDDGRMDMTDLQLRLNLRNEILQIPSQGTFTLAKDENAILPFNLKLGDTVLKYATAQPLMKIDDDGVEHYFFFAPEGLTTEYMFDKNTVKGKSQFNPVAGLKSTFTVKTQKGKRFKITTLTREQALNSVKVNGKLLMTDATVLPSEDGVQLLSLGKNSFEYILYPSKNGFKSQIKEVAAIVPDFSFKKVGSRRMTVHFPDEQSVPQVHEYFLRIDYTGDVAMAFLNGELQLDHFYHGVPWTIGLKRFKTLMKKEDMNFYFRPLQWNAPFLSSLPEEAVPDFAKGAVLDIKEVTVIPEYVTTIKF